MARSASRFFYWSNFDSTAAPVAALLRDHQRGQVGKVTAKRRPRRRGPGEK